MRRSSVMGDTERSGVGVGVCVRVTVVDLSVRSYHRRPRATGGSATSPDWANESSASCAREGGTACRPTPAGDDGSVATAGGRVSNDQMSGITDPRAGVATVAGLEESVDRATSDESTSAADNGGATGRACAVAPGPGTVDLVDRSPGSWRCSASMRSSDIVSDEREVTVGSAVITVCRGEAVRRAVGAANAEAGVAAGAAEAGRVVGGTGNTIGVC